MSTSELKMANAAFEMTCFEIAGSVVALYDEKALATHAHLLNDLIIKYHAARQRVDDALNAIAEGKE